MIAVKRREFMTLLGGAAATCPLAARAQQPERMRRIGVLMNASADDKDGQARIIAFVQALQEFGWTDGRNARLDIRWGAGDGERYRRYATELVALAPDVILAPTSPVVAALQRVTSTVPVVFTGVIDPVGAGFVANLARPGGNMTGFAAFEYGVSGKWLALLKEIAPAVTRAAILRDPSIAAGIGQLAAMQAVAPSLGVELSPLDIRGDSELDRAVAEFARLPNGGVVVTAGPAANVRREQISLLMARHRLPAVYPFRYYVESGGLIAYGSVSLPSIGPRPAMSTAYSKARSRPTCRCRHRPNTSWSLT
jgi:putative tryptophan/tyrosine transport system substrate-binding protein